jgi:ribosome-associated toxin RatA of RatAB toxin-antitoxin module
MMSGGMRSLLAITVVGFLLAGGNAWADGGFSAGELAKLRRGGQVSRPLRNARSDQVGGTAWILVNADVDTVWRAITDFSSYRRFVPAAQRSRTLQKNGDVRIVSMRQESGLIQVDYALRFVLDNRKREVRFRIDHRRPHEVRDGWGFFKVEPREDGRTLVSYGVVVEPGSSVLAAIVGDELRDRVLSIPRRLKRWVEGPGRPRYARTPGRRFAGGASTAPGDRHP